MEKHSPHIVSKICPFAQICYVCGKIPEKAALLCSYMIKLDNIYETRKNVPNVQMYLICKTSTEFSEQSVEVVELYAEGVVTCKRW